MTSIQSNVAGYKTYAIDFTGKMTKAEAKAELASKGITVTDAQIEAEMENGTISGEALSKIAAQYGNWQTDISSMWKVNTEKTEAEKVSDFFKLQPTESKKTDFTTVQESPGTNKAVIVDYLKGYYGDNKSTGIDKYSADNKQLQGLNAMLDDNQLELLGKAGFSRNEIIEIINQSFNVGISLNTDGTYNLPKGHTVQWSCNRYGNDFNTKMTQMLQERGLEDTQANRNKINNEAKDIYKKFDSQLAVASGNTAEIGDLEEKLEQLVETVNRNDKLITNLKNEINSLQPQIKKEFDDAIQEADDIEEEVKEQAKQKADEELQKYIDAEGQMSYATFEENLGNAIDSIDVSGRLSALAKKIAAASQNMKLLQADVSQIGNLIKQNDAIRKDMGDINAEISIKRAAAEEESTNKKKLIDPIGFKLSSGVQVDFFIDENQDNKVALDGSEFLGAKNGWSEMTALDTTGDGKVDYNELAATNNLKVVVTKTDGTQEIKNISDYFNQGDSIDLNSYKEVGTTDTKGNIHVADFTGSVGGETIKGYQTFDTVETIIESYHQVGDDEFKRGVYSALEGTGVTADEFDDIIEGLNDLLSDANKANNGIGSNITAAIDETKTDTETKAKNHTFDRVGGDGGDDDDIEIGGTGGTRKTQKKTYVSGTSIAFAPLYNATTKSKCNQEYSTLLNQINDDYTGTDKLSALHDLRNNYAQALHNRFLGIESIADLEKEWDDKETNIYNQCQNEGITYKKAKVFIESGMHSERK